jgi:hypothetical protein
MTHTEHHARSREFRWLLLSQARQSAGDVRGETRAAKRRIRWATVAERARNAARGGR